MMPLGALNLTQCVPSRVALLRYAPSALSPHIPQTFDGLYLSCKSSGSIIIVLLFVVACWVQVE